MALVPNFSAKEFFDDLQARMERIERAVLMSLRKIGETFVKNARENGTYNDITGNLRSSIGYVILKNGEQIYENFKTVSGGPSGNNIAQKVARDVGKKFPKGYVLIVVAGMEYAAAVESRGRDVLTASSITAKSDLEKAIASLKTKIPNMR